MSLGRDGVLHRLRPAPSSDPEPVKNLLPLERPLPVNTLQLASDVAEPPDDALVLEVGTENVDVAWADAPKRRGAVTLQIHGRGSGLSEVEIRPDGVEPPRWERNLRRIAWACVIIPFAVHFYGGNLLLPLGLVFFAILSERRISRRNYASKCDELADEVHDRLQPFLASAQTLAPYREMKSLPGADDKHHGT